MLTLTALELAAIIYVATSVGAFIGILVTALNNAGRSDDDDPT